MIGSEIGRHGGKAAFRRQRVRHRGGAELEASELEPSAAIAVLQDWLLKGH
jgi:hypothetical protein